MGRHGRSSKMYGKIVGKDADERPGWKGPGYQKPKTEKPKAKAPPPPTESVVSEPQSLVPVALQQLLLNVFKDGFPELLASNDLQQLLQDVKAALYDRDFNRAFGSKENLEVYSIRWSPSRALCYQSILAEIWESFPELPSLNKAQRKSADGVNVSPSTASSTLRVVCIGGGAAEIVAFGGLVRYLQDVSSPGAVEHSTESVTETSISESQGIQSPDNNPTLDLLLLDVAQWQDAVQTLQKSLISPPTLSKYASTAAKEANFPLLKDSHMSVRFQAEDILTTGPKQLNDYFGKVPTLITLLFTLNELYSASIGKTTAFLLNLTSAVKPGSLLLVVDSPGSYSETTVGTEAKKYPMKWLLDHTLLEQGKKKGKSEEAGAEVEREGEASSETKAPVAWEKVLSEDSKWFRVAEVLRYPIPLENMRYQIHLYRKT